MKTFFKLCLLLGALGLLIAGCLILDQLKRQNLVIPRTVLGNLQLGAMSYEEVSNIVKQRFDAFLTTPFSIAARGEVQTAVFKEFLGPANEVPVMSQIPFAGEYSNVEIFLFSIAGRRIMPDISIPESEVLRVVDEKFPSLPKIRNAHFVLKRGKIVIEEGQSGVRVDSQKLVVQLKTNAMFLETLPVFAEFSEVEPDISSDDLRPYEFPILRSFYRKLTFIYENKKWSVDFSKYPEQVLFERTGAPPTSQDAIPFSIKWDPVSFSNFVNEKMAAELEDPPENVRIWRDDEGKVQFEGRGIDGRSIDREKLLAMVNVNFNSGPVEEIEVPINVIKAIIDVTDEFSALGIKELVAVGHTQFKGSPPNRIHNIGVGISKFSGLIVPQGEVFSFNENLGRVDDTTGYKKELVIKPEGTIPEFGGGLCQVSSTMYRAAVYGGFPIVERDPHTYAVSYYSQIGGHGLDATIYPPSRDLKFRNDTPAALLIQSYVDGLNAYFKLYGTSDGRVITMEGPYISNSVAAPTEPVLIPDKNMSPGEKKQVEKPHAGFDARWYRYIDKHGSQTKEEIFTRYKAVPAKFLVGGKISAEGENEGIAEEQTSY